MIQMAYPLGQTLCVGNEKMIIVGGTYLITPLGPKRVFWPLIRHSFHLECKSLICKELKYLCIGGVVKSCGEEQLKSEIFLMVSDVVFCVVCTHVMEVAPSCCLACMIYVYQKVPNPCPLLAVAPQHFSCQKRLKKKIESPYTSDKQCQTYNLLHTAIQKTHSILCDVCIN